MQTAKEDRAALSFIDYIDIHKGRRFLVCGTGPSIDQYSLSFYEEFDGVTIGVNDIQDRFTPDYYMNMHDNPHILRDNIEGIDAVYSFNNPSSAIAPKKTGLVSMVGTVSLAALTVAYQMGASEIFLIGVDLKATEENHHFDGCSSLFASGGTHVIECEDELKATVRGFDRAFEAYRGQGVNVVNLSRNSILRANNV